MPSTAHGSRISLNQATPDSPAPETVARTIREGFDRHYSLFRAYCAEARNCIEHADWRKLAEINRERILNYDLRVNDTVRALERELGTASRNAQAWPKIKRAYIGQLMDHLQADCAETFYNSVACRVLKREYYNNENIFWRPALSTEHLQGSQPAYRSYYPRSEGLRRCLLSMLTRPGLANRFESLRRDVRRLERAIVEARPKRWVRESNNQVQVLNSLFFRNKAAYLVGRSINGDAVDPFVIPLLQNDDGSIYVDTLITRTKDAAILFSFARAYFFVDMEVPSAYVSFLQAFMPGKSVVDLYSILGLQKQAKTLFYRELQFHLSHSRDNFKIAPGVPGMVMLVFYLPSLDFVFKVIRDRFEAPKAWRTRSNTRKSRSRWAGSTRTCCNSCRARLPETSSSKGTC
jgi:isocitrate dehydrogenase kinase/phosphatase